MECGVTQECNETYLESQNVDIRDSEDNFQKFMLELFEKNGILNDLRAYLRSHIVNVLRSTQTGEYPSCQKNFIQRLELSFQALNILIAEYLLRLEFGYSLSVFISEIPLANMVFQFAKSLMQRNNEDQLLDIRFSENDVWSILNYLGVPCDSELASHIIQMYKTDKTTPLLICILKGQWIYEKSAADMAIASEETLTSQSYALSANEVQNNTKNEMQPDLEKCKHLKYCKTCQNHMSNIKDKYKKKKKHMFQNIKSSVNQFNAKHLMKNIGVLERGLVDELFHQLKSVYESEVEMLKIEEQKKIKRSMASHELQLQKEREEMEQSLKDREEELERKVIEKKKFLWGLARALRDQHQHMSRAMHDVRVESSRLTAKEESLKSQMAEAEQILQKRGEEMRLQISNELSILEDHLSSMKKERECINRERIELEKLKIIEETTSRPNKKPNIDSEVNSHYDLLKNELEILKKYLESSKLSPKCVIERGTVTDLCDVNSKLNIGLNNHNHGADRTRNEEFDDKLKNQVVNDLKKKNVNFTPCKLDEIYRDRSHGRSHSSGSSETGDLSATCQRHADVIHALREENTRLKECTRHQQAHIAALSRATMLPSPAPRARPRTAPPLAPPPAPAPTTQPIHFLRNMNSSPVGVGWRKGAGEELNIFSDAQPRVLMPADTIPFVGVLRDRHNANRRQMMGQWRAVRSRTCPLVGVTKRSFSPLRERRGSSSLSVSYPKASCSLQPDGTIPNKSTREKSPPHPSSTRSREKSPKSVFKEAKAKLRNIKDISIVAHEKSPNSVLREAKLRLRKLEIEAEAMEKSYLDFRRRQSELKVERNTRLFIQDPEPGHTIDFTKFCKSSGKQTNEPHDGRSVETDGTKRVYSLQKIDNTEMNQMDVPLTDYKKSLRQDFDKYLREYQTKITETHFRKRTVEDIINPIPRVYKEVNGENSKVNTNYLETPLAEFRKFYQFNRKNVEDKEKVNVKEVKTKTEVSESRISECDEPQSEVHESVAEQTKGSKKSELELLKQNINKMCNLNNNFETEFEDKLHIASIDEKKDFPKVEEQNLLRVEVENIIKTNQNISVIVQSTVLDTAMPVCKDDSPNDINFGESSIILTPKISRSGSDDSLDRDVPPDRMKRSLSPEQQAHLTRNDVLDAIFNEDETKKSETDVNLDIFNDILEESDKEEDYDDNLSADVEIYNSHTDLPNSPISLVRDLQNSEHDNFWK